METIYPKKLKLGDKIRIITPSRSLSIISEECCRISNTRFKQLQLELTFGKHVNECDEFNSSSINSRLEDIHNAFEDTSVAAIITAIGGFNSNQLLKYIDYGIVSRNPKVFCGYSDITAIATAITAKTGLVTYYGPHYSSFGQLQHFEYSLEHFVECLFSNDPVEVTQSPTWSDDPWYMDQESRNLLNSNGYKAINPGKAEGVCLGGNLCTFNLLQGTEFMPDLKNSILFIEDDSTSNPVTFDRDLQSLIHQPGFESVLGIVIGRFQKTSKMTDSLLDLIIKSKKELDGIPVIADANFGHADPKFTFPIGGIVQIDANPGRTGIRIVKH